MLWGPVPRAAESCRWLCRRLSAPGRSPSGLKDSSASMKGRLSCSKTVPFCVAPRPPWALTSQQSRWTKVTLGLRMSSSTFSCGKEQRVDKPT